MRVTGGLLYFTGGLLMAWNVYQTIRGRCETKRLWTRPCRPKAQQRSLPSKEHGPCRF
jgi:cytochrome c oxidase cbb3-type subunit 1